MAMVESSVDEITTEEGTEPPMRVEHARYDGGERDGGGSLFDWFEMLVRC